WTAPQKLDTQLTEVQFFMSSRKFSLELRLAAVQHYLSGKDGFREAATHFGVGRTALRRWVAAYELHGPDGLSRKTGQFLPEFRLNVVIAVIRDKLSLREATAKFNISGESTVYQWVKCYQTDGIDALLNLRQGRKKLEKDITPPSVTTDIPAEQLTEEQKLAEIRFLRAQVDYLKKLRALAQEKITDKKRR
ncbi:helix-turn-helix domain-containing protein, partial [Vagococcus sp. WN89Y]|uniref:helix-turn-helix domain-containing protein n=1 Tax=Vagococcus sp. WN89Y TaxID=3457258 RepID=UPI003FCCC3E1